MVDVRDVRDIKFGDDRFRGLVSAERQILPLHIDFDGRLYKSSDSRANNSKSSIESQIVLSPIFSLWRKTTFKFSN